MNDFGADGLDQLLRLAPWIMAVLLAGGLVVGYCIGKLL